MLLLHLMLLTSLYHSIVFYFISYLYVYIHFLCFIFSLIFSNILLIYLMHLTNFFPPKTFIYSAYCYCCKSNQNAMNMKIKYTLKPLDPAQKLQSTEWCVNIRTSKWIPLSEPFYVVIMLVEKRLMKPQFPYSEWGFYLITQCIRVSQSKRLHCHHFKPVWSPNGLVVVLSFACSLALLLM